MIRWERGVNAFLAGVDLFLQEQVVIKPGWPFPMYPFSILLSAMTQRDMGSSPEAAAMLLDFQVSTIVTLSLIVFSL